MDGYAWIDKARDGESNMAIDRLLLEAAERDQCALLRLYRWSEPTLSLGHFQASVDRRNHLPSADLPSVIRASGGGAIVHHHEWTYALAIPVGRNRVGAATHLYDLVHDALVAGLRGLGWDAHKWTASCRPSEPQPAARSSSAAVAGWVPVAETLPECSEGSPRRDAPFLCFQRRSCGDILCAGSKVVGSAQRRLGASVLQHGSVLCSTSPFAPELPGLAELPRSSTAAASEAGPDREHRGRAGDQFLKKSDVGNENFGYNVLSWVVAPLFRNLDVFWTETASPPDLIESWSRR